MNPYNAGKQAALEKYAGSGLGAGLGTILGGGAGALIGGIPGAAIGAGLGAPIGGALGNMWSGEDATPVASAGGGLLGGLAGIPAGALAGAGLGAGVGALLPEKYNLAHHAIEGVHGAGLMAAPDHAKKMLAGYNLGPRAHNALGGAGYGALAGAGLGLLAGPVMGAVMGHRGSVKRHARRAARDERELLEDIANEEGR